MVQPNELLMGVVYKVLPKCGRKGCNCDFEAEDCAGKLLKVDHILDTVKTSCGGYIEHPVGSNRFVGRRLVISCYHLQFCFSRQWMEKIK